MNQHRLVDQQRKLYNIIFETIQSYHIHEEDKKPTGKSEHFEVEYDNDRQDQCSNYGAYDPLIPAHPFRHGAQYLLTFINGTVHIRKLPKKKKKGPDSL